MINSGVGGAITAALYLSEFVTRKPNKSIDANNEEDESEELTEAKNETENTFKPFVWFHLDFMGTKDSKAEPQGLRAMFEYIRKEYSLQK